MHTRWKKEEVEQFLKNERILYHKIELPYGLSTSGTDRSTTLNRIFPADMTGKTVLDVGCGYGYFCFEALKRGARRAVGIELHPEVLRKATLLADCLGLKPEFKGMDIDKDPIDEMFDYVICLNVFHHLRHPFTVLDKLISAVRERLILEIAHVNCHERKKLSLFQRPFVNRLPVIFVTKGQSFFITAPAIDNLLRYHRNMFARVETFSSEFKKRFITVAHKRIIGRLIVIADPGSDRNSAFAKRLMKGEIPALAEKLKIDDPSAWQFADECTLEQLDNPYVGKLIFHYSFPSRSIEEAITHDRVKVLDILDTAEKITFLTLWDPGRLKEHLLQRYISERQAHGRHPKERHMKVLEEYENPTKVRRLYEEWFRFCQSKSENHLVVSLGGNMQFHTIHEWKKLASSISISGKHE